MRSIKEDNKLLASLAVFRELYNSEKDVYGIISIFLKDLIKTNSLYSFSLNEITDKLNTSFEFNIPSAVVKTSLGRLKFIEKTRTDYIVRDITSIKTINIDEKQQSISSNNEEIITNLFRFIEKKKNIVLSTIERDKISHSFCCFLLDENNGDEYIEYITAFILENEANTSFRDQLNLIREGVILYSGIKYNSNLNDLGSWRTELTIFIETEILFHLAGYNGELFKTLALDFLGYVLEINRKAQKKLIRLKYFNEVKIEIEGFFRKALSLLEGNERSNPNVTAMVSILNGCRKPSDIIEKKADFFSLMQGYGIEEDGYDEYYTLENHHYNIVSKEIIEKVSKELDQDAEKHLKFLNFVAIHRKERNSESFENVGYILLSGNSTTLKVAWNDLLKEEGNVPLATHLSFLTNKFWFKLNKGFGKEILPKSFSIITKAQILLSKVLNDSVGEKYFELQKEFKEGKLTEEQAKARIIDLRNRVRKPEEIKNDIAQDVLTTITEDSLEKFIQEQKHFKIQAEQKEEENLKLQEELGNKMLIESRLVKEKRQIESLFLESKEQILNEKKGLKNTLEKQKIPLDKIAKLKYVKLKFFLGGIIITYYILLISSIFYFTWEKMEQYTFILSLIPLILSALYLLVFEHNINPITFLSKRRDSYFIKVYNEFSFDIDSLNNVNEAIKKLEKELGEIKKGEGQLSINDTSSTELALSNI